jgi:hypothetical protein
LRAGRGSCWSLIRSRLVTAAGQSAANPSC